MRRQERRWRSQNGSIILVVGVVATLAILAVALVFLVNNAQSNTARDRQRTQAFSLAEGAMDDGMALLARTWPSTAAPSWDPVDFWTRFSTNSTGTIDYTSPRAGTDPAKLVFFDNFDTNGDGVVGYNPATEAWDAAVDTKSDNLMYVEAQGNVGSKSARVRALVRRNFLNLGLLANVAACTAGQLYVNAAATLGAEVLTPGFNQARALDYIWDPKGNTDQIINTSGNQSVSNMISPETLALLKIAAQSAVPIRYYTSQPPDSAFLGGGLIYIDAPGVDISWPSNVKTTNTGDGIGIVDPVSEKVLPPGALIVRARSFKWQANVGEHEAIPAYYGLIYCDGPITLSGTMEIHGMIVSADNTSEAVRLTGNEQLIYNDNVRQNLNMEFPSTVTIERNSWREIQPM